MPDLIVECYALATKRIQQLQRAGCIPIDLQPQAARDGIQRYERALASALRRGTAFELDGSDRKRIVRVLRVPSSDEEFDWALAALSQMSQLWLPSYTELVDSFWQAGGPLNVSLADRYQVLPVPSWGLSRVLMAVRGVDIVTDESVSGLEADALFSEVAVVPLEPGDELDAVPLVLPRRELASKDVRFGGSCLIREKSDLGLDSSAPAGTFRVRSLKRGPSPNGIALARWAKTAELSVMVLPELTVDDKYEAELVGEIEAQTLPHLDVLVAGSWHRRVSGRYFNIANLFVGSKPKVSYSKRQLPHIKGFGRENVEPGRAFVVRDTAIGRVAVGICADLNVVSWLNVVRKLKADLVLVPSMNPAAGRDKNLHLRCKAMAATVWPTSVYCVNTCSAKSVKPPTIRHDISFLYLPIASADCTTWTDCDIGEPFCSHVLDLSEILKRLGASD